MPIIQVNLLEGRTVEQKRELARLLCEATVKALGAKPESVRVLMHEMGLEDFSVAGVTMLDSRAAAAKATHPGTAVGATNGAARDTQVTS